MLHRVTATDGVAITYAELGPGGGRPIVLCHGLCASGRQFAADAHYFAGLGYRVLVPDLRGHGASGRPGGFAPAGFTLERMAGDMFAMLDDAGVATVDWVGNSLGGIVALKMLAMVPERVSSLASFGTSYRLSLPAAAAQVFPLVYGLFGRRLVASVMARLTTDDTDGRRLVAEMLHAFDPRVGRAIAANIGRYDLIAAAAAYGGPMLMIRGGRDRGVNAALGPTLRAMSGRANFTRVELPRAGHCANLDAPQAVRAALLEFWQRARPEPIARRE